MLENPSNVSLFILGLKFDKMYRRLAETRKKVVLKYGTAFEGSVVQHHGISTLALYLITNRTGLDKHHSNLKMVTLSLLLAQKS